MYRGMRPAAGPKPAACSRFRNPPFPDPPLSSDPNLTDDVRRDYNRHKAQGQILQKHDAAHIVALGLEAVEEEHERVEAEPGVVGADSGEILRVLPRAVQYECHEQQWHNA